MEAYQKELLSLLSQSLFGIKTDTVISEKVLTEARQQAVSTLISETDYAVLSSNIRVDAAHAELTTVLANIPFVTIKGYS